MMRTGCLLAARVLEDVQAEVAVARGDVLLAALLEGLDAPEVASALVYKAAHLLQLAVRDPDDPETARIVGEVREVGVLLGGRDLVNREVAGAGRLRTQPCAGYRTRASWYL